MTFVYSAIALTGFTLKSSIEFNEIRCCTFDSERNFQEIQTKHRSVYLNSLGE